MAIRDALNALNLLLDLGLDLDEIDQWTANNEYFMEVGVVAVEVARATDGRLNWQGFKDRWWGPLSEVYRSVDDRADACRLAYLAYCSRFYQTIPLPEAVTSLPSDEVCAFPFCDLEEATHTDHIWPQAWGGPNSDWNKQQLCPIHNQMKSSFPGLNFSDPTPLREALGRSLR